ncbi:MAG: hypothetical protein U0804_11785 [Gemmataceae bacterium]
MIPPDMPLDEYDRRVSEEIKARKAIDPNPRTFSGERVRKLLTDLQDRCERTGRADPAFLDELMAELLAEPTT